MMYNCLAIKENEAPALARLWGYFFVLSGRIFKMTIGDE
jgi:hypothetical protein